MRYGSANAGGGPDIEEPFSASWVLGKGVAGEESQVDWGMVAVIGGGSISEFVVDARGGTAGSGNKGMASSAEDVSMVMCLVALHARRCV